MSFLIDTCIFVDYLRNHGPAIEFLNSLQQKNILISAITVAELLSGKINEDAEKRATLINFISECIVVDVTTTIGVRAGDIRRSTGVALPDALIAASAIEEGAELITKNIRDFKGIKGLKVREPY